MNSEHILAAEAKERQRQGGREKVVQNSAQPSGKTREKLAAIAGTSHDTISRVKFIKNNAPPAVVLALRCGDMSINEGYKRAIGMASAE